MDVYVVGEDAATKEIVKKILVYCGHNYFHVLKDLPARGTEIKRNINNYNILSGNNPVILLLDLDEGCPPELIKALGIINKNHMFIINIAVDEAESWLMADRETFAEYFKVDINVIPQSHRTKLNGHKEVVEMDFCIKPSMYLNTRIIPFSRSIDIKQQMLPQAGAYKGREYNSVMVPFIRDYWNIDNAKKNSDSLNRMIRRVKSLIL